MNAEEFVSGDARIVALFAVNGITPVRKETRRRPDGKVKTLYIFERTANLTSLHGQFLSGGPMSITPFQILDTYQATIREMLTLARDHKE